jgi:chitinase
MLTKVPGTADQGPYAYNTRSGLWVGYDDIESAIQKANYLVQNGFGGAAIWTLDFDDFNNLCCHGPSPILTAVSQAVRGQTNKHIGRKTSRCITSPAVVTPKPPVFDIWDNGSEG